MQRLMGFIHAVNVLKTEEVVEKQEHLPVGAKARHGLDGLGSVNWKMTDVPE